MAAVVPSYKGYRYPVGHRQLTGAALRYWHGWIGRVDRRGPRQAAVVVPVIWFQVVNRVSISRRYSLAPSR
jgi:hypothetical protein